jgi:hypothetical protein
MFSRDSLLVFTGMLSFQDLANYFVDMTCLFFRFDG